MTLSDTRQPQGQPLTTGLRCANPNCIVHEEKEAPYVRNKFHLLTHDKAAAGRLRCFYCESERDAFVIANRKNKWYTTDTFALAGITNQNVRDFLFFADESDAISSGFHTRKNFGAKHSRMAAGQS